MRVPLRLALVLTASLALGAGVTAPLSPAQAALDDDAWCGGGVTAPCVVSLTRDGVPVDRDDWWVAFSTSTVEGGRYVSFTVAPTDSTADGDADPLIDMGAGERGRTWSMTLDTGTLVPRVTSVTGSQVVVGRTHLSGGHRVTITGRPVRITDNDECAVGTWPWVCPPQATVEAEGYFSGTVTDYGQWTDAEQRESMYGLDYASNVAVGSLPPEVVVSPDTGTERLLLRLANQHRHPDGTVFRGDVDVRIPNAMLRSVYGVDDPSSLTGSGLDASIGSGTGTVDVRQEPGDAAMLVQARGLTFPVKTVTTASAVAAKSVQSSSRTLTVDRGVITPTRPKKVKGKRLSWHRARITYKKARSRGSAVTRHVVRCDAPGKGGVITRRTKGRKLVVDRLAIREPYKCKVRAVSKAGKGKWSKTVKVKARPRR